MLVAEIVLFGLVLKENSITQNIPNINWMLFPKTSIKLLLFSNRNYFYLSIRKRIYYKIFIVEM